MISVSLHLDRLRAAVTVLCDLMRYACLPPRDVPFSQATRTSNPRPVLLPIGALARLCVALLSCTTDAQAEGHVDPITHALETSVVPYIWEHGCHLTMGLAKWCVTPVLDLYTFA